MTDTPVSHSGPLPPISTYEVVPYQVQNRILTCKYYGADGHEVRADALDCRHQGGAVDFICIFQRPILSVPPSIRPQDPLLDNITLFAAVVKTKGIDYDPLPKTYLADERRSLTIGVYPNLSRQVILIFSTLDENGDLLLLPTPDPEIKNSTDGTYPPPPKT
jgi:hypothetical protein